MITDILLSKIVSHYEADARQVKIAIENCKAKGVLTKQELWQLDRQGLPISRILTTIIKPAHTDGLISLLDSRKITYDDLVCMIDIIAQDAEQQRQSRIIAQRNY